MSCNRWPEVCGTSSDARLQASLGMAEASTASEQERRQPADRLKNDLTKRQTNSRESLKNLESHNEHCEWVSCRENRRSKPVCTNRKSASAERCLRALGATLAMGIPVIRRSKHSRQGVFSHQGLRKASAAAPVNTGLAGSTGMAGEKITHEESERRLAVGNVYIFGLGS